MLDETFVIARIDIHDRDMAIIDVVNNIGRARGILISYIAEYQDMTIKSVLDDYANELEPPLPRVELNKWDVVCISQLER